MILDGQNIMHQAKNKNGRSSIAAVVSQLLIFSSVKFGSTTSRHNVDRETTYLGLMLHAFEIS